MLTDHKPTCTWNVERNPDTGEIEDAYAIDEDCNCGYIDVPALLAANAREREAMLADPNADIPF